MPKSHKDPPVYDKNKGYIRWKTETKLWADMVQMNGTLKEETIGQVVALNALSDAENEGDIRGKVIEALGPVELGEIEQFEVVDDLGHPSLHLGLI